MPSGISISVFPFARLQDNPQAFGADPSREGGIAALLTLSRFFTACAKRLTRFTGSHD